MLKKFKQTEDFDHFEPPKILQKAANGPQAALWTPLM